MAAAKIILSAVNVVDPPVAETAPLIVNVLSSPPAVNVTVPLVETVPTDKLPSVLTTVITPDPVVAPSVAPLLSVTTTSPVPVPVRLRVVAVVLTGVPGTPTSPSAPPPLKFTVPPLTD